MQCEKSERWSSQGFNCTYDPSTRTRPKGVLYTIDFKQIRQDWDNCLAEDYEEWSPPIPDLCLLGHNFTFERRKRQAQCFNSKKYDRPVRSHVCGCDAEDVECDYGFFRKDYQSPCERVEEVARKRTCPALAEGSYKFSNSHLRLIHGDNCSGIKELVPDIYLPKNEAWAHHHHHRSGFSFWRFLLTTTIVIGLLSGAFVAWLKLFASEDVKDSVSEVCSPFTSFCGSSCGMLFDCFRSSSARLAGGATPTDAFFSPLAGGEGLDFDDADAHNAPMVGKTAPPGQQTMP